MAIGKERKGFDSFEEVADVPRVEALLTAELERRIMEALPECTTESGEAEENTSVRCSVAFLRRRFTPCLQEQENLAVYGEMKATLAVAFWSLDERVDYAPLCASFALRPYLLLAEGVHAGVRIGVCEAVEGGFPLNEIWTFEASYPVFKRIEVPRWLEPRVKGFSKSSPDLYPRPVWDDRDEPEGVLG